MDDAARELAKKLYAARDKLVWGIREGKPLTGLPDETTLGILRKLIADEIGREPTPDEVQWTLQSGG